MTSQLEKLLAYLRERAPAGIALAFSGGTDSALLLAALAALQQEAPFPLKALTMRSPLQFPEESKDAQNEAARLGVDLEICPVDPLQLPDFRDNPPDRCYWCKRHFFGLFREKATALGLTWLLDGTNADDRQSYRPGLKALAELGVVSPLAELGFSKQDVRELARELSVSAWKKPSAPCLATRFPYGTRLTAENLRKTAEAERFVRGLLPAGTPLRLRVQENGTLARIETTPEAFPTLLRARTTITAALRALGFAFIALDLDGFRSGSMDLALP